MTISESIEEFILEQRCRGNSVKTIEYYDLILRRFSDFADKLQLTDVDQITLTVCKQFYLWLREQALSSVSIQSYIRGYRAYIEWLYESDLIDEDLCDRFRLPKATHKVIDILTDSDIQRLLASFDTATYTGLRDYTICALMIDTGLRLNEVVTLQAKHVHLDDGYLIVTGKGDKQRVVPFGSFTAATLRSYVDNKKSWCPPIAAFFVTIEGDPISINTLKDVFRRLKDRVGIPRLHPHLLRHTFATKYLANGGDIYTLQRILGHSTLDMVKKYLHLSNQLTISAYRSPMDALHNKNSPR